MAGTNPGFQASEFRQAIRFVYDMAAAPLVGNQVLFYGESTLMYTGSMDDEDVPFDPDSTVTREPATGVNVPCAVEYFDSQGESVVFGTVTPSRIIITLLDEDYTVVQDSRYVVIAGDKYLYRRTQPPSGLFDVGLFKMHFTAENET